MSKKHLHNIGTGRKMFQHACQEGAGLPRRFQPKKKANPAKEKTDGS